MNNAIYMNNNKDIDDNAIYMNNNKDIDDLKQRCDTLDKECDKIQQQFNKLQSFMDKRNKRDYFRELTCQRLVLAEFNLALWLHKKTDDANLRKMFENDLKYLISNAAIEKKYSLQHLDLFNRQCYLRGGIHDEQFNCKLATFLNYLVNNCCEELVDFEEHNGVSSFVNLQKLLETELHRLIQIENDTNNVTNAALDKLPDDLKQYINLFLKSHENCTTMFR